MPGKIYRIVCGEYFYYGSCTTSIADRKKVHKHRSKKPSGKLYEMINGKEWNIELVFEAPEGSNLREIEDAYIKPNLENPFCLNERSAKFDSEKDKRRKKNWYESNRERLLLKAKERHKMLSEGRIHPDLG
jgi:hypothetical protein